MNRPYTRSRCSRFALATGLLACLSAVSALAAPLQNVEKPGLSGNLLPKNSLSELKGIVETLQNRYEITLLVDQAITPFVSPRMPAEGAALDQALTTLASSLTGVSWRRLYLPSAQDVHALLPRKLACAIRTLDTLEPTRLVVENAEAERATTLLRSNAVPRAFVEALTSESFGEKPVYLLYALAATRDAGMSSVELYADLQSQQMESLLAMSPGQAAQALEQMVRLFQSMEPARQQQVMGRMLEAGMQSWERTPPTQRQEILEQCMQALQQSLKQAEKPLPDSGLADTNHHDYSSELKKIAAALARQHHVRIILDPAIAPDTPPKTPASATNLEQALHELTASLQGVVWRRLYLPQLQADSPLLPKKLAATARALDRLRQTSLCIENPLTKRAVTYLKDSVVSASFRDALAAEGFSARPRYLLYSTQITSDGASLEAQHADLQRQQAALLLNMQADQMAAMMQQGIEMFQGLNPEMRGRMMGLPIIAGMMATWFPRQAKEQ